MWLQANMSGYWVSCELHSPQNMKILNSLSALDVEKIRFSLPNKAVESLTTEPVLGAALRDVGAEHCAYSWVCSEAPG